MHCTNVRHETGQIEGQRESQAGKEWVGRLHKLLKRVQSAADVTLDNEGAARVESLGGTSGVRGVHIISLRQ